MGAPEEISVPQESVVGSVLREILYLLLKIVAIAAAFVVVFTFVFGVLRYSENAMLPAVKDGDLVFYYRVEKEYTASDLVVLRYQGHEQVRRVVATAGDVVDITEEGLMINGALQQEHEIYEQTQRYDTGVEFPMELKEGQIFVLGDSRENASDSRVYGAVDVHDTLGKVMTIVRRRGF